MGSGKIPQSGIDLRRFNYSQKKELNHHACFEFENSIFFSRTKERQNLRAKTRTQRIYLSKLNMVSLHPPKKGGVKKWFSPPIRINKYIHVAATKLYVLSRVVNTNIAKLQLNYEKKLTNAKTPIPMVTVHEKSLDLCFCLRWH